MVSRIFGEEEKRRRIAGASAARPRELISPKHWLATSKVRSLTLVSRIPTIDTGTGNQNLIDDREDAFAGDPLAISASDGGVVKDGGSIELDTTAVDVARKRNLIRMKIVKAGPAYHILRDVA